MGDIYLPAKSGAIFDPIIDPGPPYWVGSELNFFNRPYRKFLARLINVDVAKKVKNTHAIFQIIFVCGDHGCPH